MFLVTDNGKGPLQDEEVTRLFKMYGASPRELVLDGHRPNHHHEFIIAQVRQMDLGTLPLLKVLLHPRTSILPTTSHESNLLTTNARSLVRLLLPDSHLSFFGMST